MSPTSFVTATLRLRNFFINTDPLWENWDDLQITSIQFQIQRADSPNAPISTVDASIGRTYSQATAKLVQNATYRIRAIVKSLTNPDGFQGPWLVFQSDDTTLYYYFGFKVVNDDNGLPIEGAEMTLTTEEETTPFPSPALESRADGLIYMMRLPADVYTYEVTHTDFQTAEGDFNLPLANGEIKEIRMEPNP